MGSSTSPPMCPPWPPPTLPTPTLPTHSLEPHTSPPILMQLTLPSTLPVLSLVAPSPVLPATPPVRKSTRCPGVEGRKGRLSLPSLVLLILVRLIVVLPTLVLHIHRLLPRVLSPRSISCWLCSS